MSTYFDMEWSCIETLDVRSKKKLLDKKRGSFRNDKKEQTNVEQIHECKSEVHNKSNELQPVCSFFSSVARAWKIKTEWKHWIYWNYTFFCIVGTSRISGVLLYPLYLFLAIVCSLKAHCIVHGVTHRTEEEFKKKHTMIGCTWQI